MKVSAKLQEPFDMYHMRTTNPFPVLTPSCKAFGFEGSGTYLSFTEVIKRQRESMVGELRQCGCAL